jgi:hypothetical protein
MRYLMTTLALGLIAAGAPQPRLQQRADVGSVPVAKGAIIAGRATCGLRTWLLTDSPELIAVAARPQGAIVVSRVPVQQLRSNERPWGLACLADGTLWTMADGHELAQVSDEGRIVRRVTLPQPRLGLFSVGDRFLSQDLPMEIGQPVLALSSPAEPGKRWASPGLLARKGRSHEENLTRNLVTCGLGGDAGLPCWFVGEARIVVSTPRGAHDVSLDHLSSLFLDPTLPIWDVALVPSGMWVLVTGRQSDDGHHVASRLLRVDGRFQVTASLDLQRSARMLVAAAASRCVLLLSDDRLVEVELV